MPQKTDTGMGDWMLSALTPPILLGLIGWKLTQDTLLQLGQASEELFRGDRLPNLKSTDSSPSSLNS